MGYKLYFNEKEMKDLRNKLVDIAGTSKNPNEATQKRLTGLGHWRNFCKTIFSGDEIDEIADSLSGLFNYVGFQKETLIYPKHHPKPKWDTAIHILKEFNIATNDAAILNMLFHGKNIDSFISNDKDVLCAIEAGLQDIGSSEFDTYTYINR